VVSAEPYLDNGVVMIPKRAEGPEGTVGIGWVPLTRDDPQYRQWLDYLSAKDMQAPRSGRRPGEGR
jgi:hypothetical protein